MDIALIAAVAENGVIGDGSQMPWHLPRDLAYFKAQTLGCPVIMGRKTFDSIVASLGKPLPGRLNVVMTRSAKLSTEQLIWVDGLANAVEAALRHAHKTGAPRVFVIGGGEVYKASLPIADQLYLTHVATQAVGSVRFPDVGDADWDCEWQESYEADERNGFKVTFARYRRAQRGVVTSQQ
jgi:dihydrofolate reductase